MNKILALTILTIASNVYAEEDKPKTKEYFDIHGNKMESKPEEGFCWHVKCRDKPEKKRRENAGKHNPYQGWNKETEDVKFGGTFSW